jgi:sirohydrochlorin ferrochelatase
LEDRLNALILLAHGSRDPLGSQPLAQIKRWVQSARPDLDVREAYLSLNEPTLEACLQGLHHEGCAQATVLPMLVSRGHHLNVELPVLIDDLQARFPSLRLSVSPHLGSDAAIVDLVLARAAQASVPIAL